MMARVARSPELADFTIEQSVNKPMTTAPMINGYNENCYIASGMLDTKPVKEAVTTQVVNRDSRPNREIESIHNQR